MMRVIVRQEPRKFCKGCGERKQLSEFYRAGKGSRNKGGIRGRCKSCVDRQTTAWDARHRDSCNRSVARYQAYLREKVFSHYSPVNPPSCTCCGSAKRLSLDHARGNGPEQRKLLGIKTAYAFYTWLVKNDFPAESEPGGEFALQVLCGSCNSSKASGSHCRMHCTLDHEHYKPMLRKRAATGNLT